MMMYINRIEGEAIWFLFILVRKTPSLQGGDISTNLLFFDILFNNFERCTSQEAI